MKFHDITCKEILLQHEIWKVSYETSYHGIQFTEQQIFSCDFPIMCKKEVCFEQR